jgi:hypothetical protein
MVLHSRTGRVLGVISILGTLLFFSACADTIDPPPINREQYVEIYVEILRAIDEEPDSIAASQRAQEILDLRGITQAELLAYAEHYINEPEHLAEVWLEIETRIRNPQGEDTTAVEEEGEARAIDSRAQSDGR